MSTHEPVKSHKNIARPSNRSFGLSFAVIFAALALWPSIFHGTGPRVWAGVIASIFLYASIFASEVLGPINSFWFKLGLTLQKAFSPFIMAFLFFVAVTPTGCIMRLLGHDPLKLRFDKDIASYWIERKPRGPERGSFIRQY